MKPYRNPPAQNITDKNREKTERVLRRKWKYRAVSSLLTCMSSLISHEMNVFLDSDTSSVVVNTIEPLALSFIERRDPAVRPISFSFRFLSYLSLRSRRLEVVGERENGCAPVFFSCAYYFQAPATQAYLICSPRYKWFLGRQQKFVSSRCPVSGGRCQIFKFRAQRRTPEKGVKPVRGSEL